MKKTDNSDVNENPPEHEKVESPEQLPEVIKKKFTELGLPPAEDSPGAFYQWDRNVILENLSSDIEGLEITSVRKAMEKYDWLKDYFWGLLDPQSDEILEESMHKWANGYFIRVEEGVKIKDPVQACLFVSSGAKQIVHNIIIAEPDSELHIVSGCSTPSLIEHTVHIGVSEYYIKKNAKLSFTMIHGWDDFTDVHTRTAVRVLDGGEYISMYVDLTPTKFLQTNPAVYLDGPGAKAELYSTILAQRKGYYDVGGRIFMNAPDTHGTILSRTVAKDNAQAIARGLLSGNAPRTKAHLECRGLMLSDNAKIIAIPELAAANRDTELTHEATVGKIEEEQLFYLETRGLPEDEAIKLIVRGFMNIDVPSIPITVKNEVNRLLDLQGGL